MDKRAGIGALKLLCQSERVWRTKSQNSQNVLRMDLRAELFGSQSQLFSLNEFGTKKIQNSQYPLRMDLRAEIGDCSESSDSV